MKQNAFKLILLALLLVCVIAVPLCGVPYYDSESIFSDDAFVTDTALGGGTSLYLAPDETDEMISLDTLEKTRDILLARLQALGFTDAKAEVVDSMVRVDISQKRYLNSLVAEVSSKGTWSFVGSSSGESLCDASMVTDAVVESSSTGGYAVTLTFTEEGAQSFYANASTYAITGSNIYLLIDGQYTAAATVSSTKVKDTFTFGGYNYESASRLASIIKNGELPATIRLEKTESFGPTLSKTVLTVLYTAAALIFVGALVAFIARGKGAGLIAFAALISDACILLTAMANQFFILNLATLIAVFVCMIAAAIFFAYAIGAVTKSGAISVSARTLFKPVNRKVLWIHAILFAVTMIAWLFAKGTFLSIVRAVWIFNFADAASYFFFLYLPVCTLSDAKNA